MTNPLEDEDPKHAEQLLRIQQLVGEWITAAPEDKENADARLHEFLIEYFLGRTVVTDKSTGDTTPLNTVPGLGDDIPHVPEPPPSAKTIGDLYSHFTSYYPIPEIDEAAATNVHTYQQAYKDHEDDIKKWSDRWETWRTSHEASLQKRGKHKKKETRRRGAIE